jgi:hypothetical protein
VDTSGATSLERSEQMTIADITTVRKGDIVRFKTYALRVETEPTTQGNFTVLSGRISVDGCPFVTKKYLAPLSVTVDHTI